MFLEMALMAAIDAAVPGNPEEAVNALRPAVDDLAARSEVFLVPYVVPGTSVRTIRQNMNRLRPYDPDGGRFDALTTWQYSTRWSTQRGKCEPVTSQVKVGITVQLPQLAQPERLGRRDRHRWDRYFEALVGHETYHAALAINGAKAMEAEMRQAPSCEVLSEISERHAETVADASRRYDALTDHGRAEGAVFP